MRLALAYLIWSDLRTSFRALILIPWHLHLMIFPPLCSHACGERSHQPGLHPKLTSIASTNLSQRLGQREGLVTWSPFLNHALLEALQLLPDCLPQSIARSEGQRVHD